MNTKTSINPPDRLNLCLKLVGTAVTSKNHLFVRTVPRGLCGLSTENQNLGQSDKHRIPLKASVVFSNGLRNFARRLLAVIAPIFFSVAYGHANGAVVRISVHTISANAENAATACRVNVTTDCSTSLIDAIGLIQTGQWQDGLGGRISKVQLRLSPGLYRLDHELTIRWGQGMTQGVELEIVGDPDTPTISGAALIDMWQRPVTSVLPKRVRPQIAAKLWTADLSAYHLPIDQTPRSRGYGIPIHPVTTELFVDNTIEPVAKWPNAGFGELVRPSSIPSDDNKTFSIVGRNVDDWADEPDLQVQAFWRWDWAAQSYLVANKDATSNLLTLSGTGSPYGIKSGQRAIVENALAELDSPGEWYLDRSTATLYFFPPDGSPGRNSEISVAPSLLRILNSANVTIRNLQFAKVRGDAIIVQDSQNIVLDNVAIRQTGNRALVIERCVDSGIRNGIIADTGEGGVFLSGGDRQALVPSRNFVEKTEIRRFSRLVKTYRFAVEIAGVGQRVVGNVISDAPHTAIFFNGNDHYISGNEIFDVVKETSDSGAIYVGRDFSFYGTIIEDNFLHDIQPGMKGGNVKGVYIDDQASGITIRRNIFARVRQPVFIGGGRDNVIERNLFFRSSPAVHLDARGVEGQRQAILDPKGTWQRGLDSIPYRGSTYSTRFPHLTQIREDDFGMPKYNVFRQNIIVSGSVASISANAQQGILIVENRIADEEIFVVRKAPEMRQAWTDFELIPGLR